jgi:hypothetical protein
MGDESPAESESMASDESESMASDESESMAPDESESADSISVSGQVPQDILELDHVYEALGHPRRRYLCYTLLESTEWSLPELAVKIVAYENDCSTSEVTDHQRERVYVSLYHVHVPKLVDEEVIQFDETTETITPGPNAQQVLLALEGMGATIDAQQEEHARESSSEDA